MSRNRKQRSLPSLLRQPEVINSIQFGLGETQGHFFVYTHYLITRKRVNPDVSMSKLGLVLILIVEINQETIKLESSNQVRHGGRRQGAGRKPFNYDARFIAARADITPLHASLILSELIDERRVWLKIFAAQDERVLLQAMMFLVSMRDGKPAQSINVTSTSINIDASEIDKVRQVIKSVVESSTLHLLPPSNSDNSTLTNSE